MSRSVIPVNPTRNVFSPNGLKDKPLSRSVSKMRLFLICIRVTQSVKQLQKGTCQATVIDTDRDIPG